MALRKMPSPVSHSPRPLGQFSGASVGVKEDLCTRRQHATQYTLLLVQSSGRRPSRERPVHDKVRESMGDGVARGGVDRNDDGKTHIAVVGCRAAVSFSW